MTVCAYGVARHAKIVLRTLVARWGSAAMLLFSRECGSLFVIRIMVAGNVMSWIYDRTAFTGWAQNPSLGELPPCNLNPGSTSGTSCPYDPSVYEWCEVHLSLVMIAVWVLSLMLSSIQCVMMLAILFYCWGSKLFCICVMLSVGNLKNQLELKPANFSVSKYVYHCISQIGLHRPWIIIVKW